MKKQKAMPGKKAAERSRPVPLVEGTPWLEWAASGIGVLIVLAVLGLLVSDLSGTGAPPALRVEAGAVTAHPGGFTLEIRVHNGSGAPAARVEVEGVLREAGQLVETGRAVLDYVPGRSVRRGGLVFSRDPRRGELELRALGHAEP
jgi:uncharacterized protein (TIGR02588 family)